MDGERFPLDLAGELLDGRWQVEAPLAKGGMATVYRARDLNLDQTVVVKVPLPEVLLLEGFRTRFQAEISGLLALRHPNVVRVLARGEHREVPYLVLEHLGGGSLSERLRAAAGGVQSVPEALAWLRPIAATLDFVHAQGVVHRDVKPGNILFDAHGNVFLSDFGIAKAVGTTRTSATITGGVLGSPEYLAPEQGSGDGTIDGRADQYALGVTAYEALSGKRPFGEGTPFQIVLRKQLEAPRPLSEVAPHLPTGCAEAVMRALAKAPTERFSSCAAFGLALARACDSSASAVVPATLAPSGPANPDASPLRRRRRRPALLLTIAGAALVAVLTWSLSRGSHDPAPRDLVERANGGPTPSPAPTPVPAAPAVRASAPDPARAPSSPPAPPEPPPGPSLAQVAAARTAAGSARSAWRDWSAQAPPTGSTDAAKAAEAAFQAGDQAVDAQRSAEAFERFVAARQGFAGALARGRAERVAAAEASAAAGAAEATQARYTTVRADLDRRVREAGQESTTQRVRVWVRVRELAEREGGPAALGLAASQAFAEAQVHAQGARHAAARSAYERAAASYERAAQQLGALVAETLTAVATGLHGRTALHDAALAGDLARVRRLLELGLDARTTDDAGVAPLHLAAWAGALNVLEALGEAGADLAQVVPLWPADPASPGSDPGPWQELTPAAVAALAGRAAVLEHLLRKPGVGAVRVLRAGSLSGTGVTEPLRCELLHVAALAGQADCLEVLLARGADPATRIAHGLTALHLAAISGRSQPIRTLLARGTLVDARAEAGWTPLHLAASQPDGEAVAALLEGGAAIDVRETGQGRTPLHLAAQSGNVEAVNRLVASKASLEARDGTGRTPMHVAASVGSLEVLRRLRAAGARIDAQDEQQHQPIHAAAQGDSIAAIEELLSWGVRPGVTAHDDFTLIHEAAAHEAPKVLEWLLGRGWDIERRSQSGLTPFIVSVKEGSLACAQLLLARGAKRDARASDDAQAIHYATYYGAPATLRWLLEQGVNPRATQTIDGVSRTALHMAAQQDQIETAAVLLEAGLDVDVRDSDALTPLHIALRGGVLKAAQFLLEQGADPRLTGGQGSSSLHYAAIGGHGELISLLAKRGLRLDAVTSEGATPLMTAAHNGRAEAVRLLVALGATVNARMPNGATALSIAVAGGHGAVADYLRSVGGR